MKKALSVLSILMWIWFGSTSLWAAPKSLNVYMVRGKGAVSILDNIKYRNVFKTGMFANHSLKIDLTSGKTAFLKEFFASDLVYLTLHSNPNVWVVGNGDPVDVQDLSKAYKAAGKGPGLVIVTGCSTIQTNAKVNFPAAIGIQPGTRKRAYIGYQKCTLGVYSDRYFRVFMALWLKPKPNGLYRTLEETRPEAKAFIKRQISLQGPETGNIAQFAELDHFVAGWFTIIGDSLLRVTDL